MDWAITIILIIISIGCVGLAIYERIKNKPTCPKTEKREFNDTAIFEEVSEIEEEPKHVPYIRKNLMTKNEWAFYKALKPVADKMNYSILCKTRVADLVDIEKGLNKSEWQTAFNRINKKHIDFILCKPENLYPILLIELDDNSHETEKGKERDKFIESVYEKTGYKLLRTKGGANLEEQITKALS